MHCSRRLLRRGLGFHVCTTNNSTHTKKVILVNSLVLCLVPDDRRNVWLNKRESHPQNIPQSSKRDDKWNWECPAPMFVYLAICLGRPVIENIRKMKASTEESNCLCSPDWRRSQIFRNEYRKDYPWLNIYIFSPFTKSKNEHLKERKKRILLSTTPRKTKSHKLLIFISSTFISYLQESLDL